MMEKINKNVKIENYQYHLPPDRIAQKPLQIRSESKLLIYKEKQIFHDRFKELPSHIKEGTLMVMNNTKVIPSRIIFRKSSGGEVEVFLVSPTQPHTVEEAMKCHNNTSWRCFFGNAKRWKIGTREQLRIAGISVQFVRTGKEDVSISWDSKDSFHELTEKLGRVPLPPYLKREVLPYDKERYQTIFAMQEGAVAAPTAGLHFDKKILDELSAKDIIPSYVTLHVSAGTFLPIKTDNAIDHPMHKEEILIDQKLIEALIENDRILSVGTTSLRAVESLYWFGQKLESNPDAVFFIEKLYPYGVANPIPKKKSLMNCLSYIRGKKVDIIKGQTEIFIFPSYSFKIVNQLITNFHLPGSTLILLIATFVGDSNWKKIYKEALMNDYRFLSYGDTSLLNL